MDDELLKVQAFAHAAREDLDPRVFLQWNRQTRMIRVALTRSGDVWVMGDMPVQAVDAKQVDRLLGLVVEGVLAVRGYAKALAEPPDASPSGWLTEPAGP
ncbi:MAG: YbjN domain-containing protein [Actinomycetota bacterium]|nr:YbjN domain-containing protein [Actinomycetota bacterium]